MKYLKYLKFIVVLITLFLLVNTNVYASKARTLGELRAELTKYKNELNKATANANKTKSEINSAKNGVFNSRDEIEKNQKAIEQAKIDIELLNIDIAKKNQDIKNYMNALQETMGNNIYLEYVLDAKDYADLVYRYTIIEQVTGYSKNQIESYERTIEENKIKQTELAKRELDLKNLITKLENDITSLGKEYDKLVEIKLDANEQVKATEEYIKYLKDIGCGENQNIESCIGLLGDSGFVRPVPRGTITSEFGYRTHPVTGARQSWHGALDIGGMASGSNIFAAANGTVSKIIEKSKCGGNMVYLHHNIKGKKYTTAYYHLSNIKVKIGQMVTRDTVVGGAGGSKAATPWDGCTTGTHLHFVIADGWYGVDYVNSNTFSQVKALNPRNYVPFPNKGIWFNSRYS